MDPTSPGSTPRAKIHPLVAAAAVAIIALCGVGIATLLYNRSASTDQQQTQSAPLADNASVTAPPVQTAPVEPAPAPAAVAPPPPVAVAPPPPVEAQPAYVPPPPPVRVCRDCGVVETIRQVKVEGQGTGMGAVGGGVVGGLLGNQGGRGNGRTALTVLGAVGGAFAGNAIEKNARSSTKYEMVVRLEDGNRRTFENAGPFPFGAGDRVRVVNNQVVAR